MVLFSWYSYGGNSAFVTITILPPVPSVFSASAAVVSAAASAAVVVSAVAVVVSAAAVVVSVADFELPQAVSAAAMHTAAASTITFFFIMNPPHYMHFFCINIEISISYTLYSIFEIIQVLFYLDSQ